MRRKGFTFIELITVTAITIALTAFMTPVFAAVKRDAKATSSLGVLRQLHLATMIYQQDYSEGGHGDLAQMGLPNAEIQSSIAAISPTKSIDLKSPCGLNPWWFSPGERLMFYYVYRPGRGGPEFVRLLDREGDRYVLFYDVNCDDAQAPVSNPHFSHLGLAVTLGGNAYKRRRTEDLHSDAFWTP